MKFKVNGKEFIVISADKFNEMKRLINEIYENCINQLEEKIKSEGKNGK